MAKIDPPFVSQYVGQDGRQTLPTITFSARAFQSKSQSQIRNETAASNFSQGIQEAAGNLYGTRQRKRPQVKNPGERKFIQFQRSLITLPLPTKLSNQYGASWAEGEIRLYTEDIINRISTGDWFKADAKSLDSLINFADRYKNIIQTSKITEVISDEINQAGKQMGYARNQALLNQQYFEKMDYRTFSFEFNLSPRSPQEAETIRQIVHEFKRAMHPTIANNQYTSYFVQFPDIFRIEINGIDPVGRRVRNFPLITEAVLTNVTTNYDSLENGLVMLREGDLPSVSLSLQFTERFMLTREDIEEGY